MSFHPVVGVKGYNYFLRGQLAVFSRLAQQTNNVNATNDGGAHGAALIQFLRGERDFPCICLRANYSAQSDLQEQLAVKRSMCLKLDQSANKNARQPVRTQRVNQ